MKQTATEFLLINLLNRFPKEMEYLFELDKNLIEDILKQAKEMEKQQITDAHGNQTKKFGGISNHTYILTGEEYYNKTFKK